MPFKPLKQAFFSTIRKILGICLLFSICLVFADTFSISKFGGIITKDDPLVMPEGNTPDSENVLTDEGQGLKPRKGFIIFSTESSRNLWSFYTSAGSKYLITQSSGVIKATLGGSIFGILIGTVSTNVITSISALGDKLYYSNTVDGLKVWDTFTVQVVTGSYKAKYLVTHKGRLWMAGIANDPRTVYGSEYLVGDNFTLAVNPTDTDPVQVQVQGALDDILTGFFATYNDTLMWYKQRSFGCIYGNRNSNFGSREYSNNVGCNYSDSIKNCDGYLRWLGNDRIIYEFDGSNYYPINLDIETLMNTIAQGDLNSRSWIQTSATDWNSGTIGVSLDTTTSSGDIIFSSSPITVNFEYTGIVQTWVVPYGLDVASFSLYGAQGNGCSGTEGGKGGYINVTTSVISNENIYIYVGQTGTGYSSGWYNGGFNGGGCGTSGHNYGGGGATDIRRGADSVNNRVLVAGGGGGGCVGNGGIGAWLKGLDGGIDAGAGTQGLGGTQIAGGAGGTGTVNGENGQLYNGGCNKSDPSLGGAGGGGGYYGGGQGASNAVGQHAPGGGGSSYSLYSGLTHSSGTRSGNGLAQISYSTPSSTYISKTYDFGTKITEWASLGLDTSLNGGSIECKVFVDSDTSIDINNSTTFIASQTFIDGTFPTIPIGRYITVSIKFSRTVSTQTPTLHSFTINMNEGSSLRTFGQYIKQRYWLGVSISSTTNNKVLVYDKNKQWQRYSGINISAIVNYSGTFYFGNNDGIFISEYGTDDNGQTINCYYKTKDYLLTSPDVYKQFEYLHLTAINSPETLQTKYYIDQYATEYDLGNYPMNTTLGLQNYRLPFPTEQIQQGKVISFKFMINSTHDWRLLNTNLYYQPEQEPSER